MIKYLLALLLFAFPAHAEVHFGRGCTDLVVKTIAGAQKSVHVAIYTFTSQPIANALIAAKKRGADVRVVTDPSQVHSMAIYSMRNIVPVAFDYKHAIQHNKFLIVDGQTVETGSFNYTKQAEYKNAENCLVLHDKELGWQYDIEFEKHWGEAK